MEVGQNIDGKIPVDGKTLHDVDFYAFGAEKWEVKGDIPIIKGEYLNWQAPKGFHSTMKKAMDKAGANDKRFWLGWMEWQKMDEVLMEQWNYQGFDEDLDKHTIEDFILTNGTSALFRIEGSDELYLQAYTSKECDIYGRPLKIKITSTSTKLNDQVIDKDNFVIINDTKDGMPFFNKIIQPISLMNETLRRIEKNLRVADPKGLLIDTFGTDSKGKSPLKECFEKMANGDDSWHAIVVSEDNWEQISRWMKELDSKNIFIPAELRDRTKELIDNFSFAKNLLQQQIGLPVDFTQDNADRSITGEITTQQGISYAILLHRFNVRKYALEQANRKFGTNLSIEWTKKNEMIYNSKEIDNSLMDGEEDGNGESYVV